MMAALMIGEAEQGKITQLIEDASRNVMDVRVLLAAARRDIDAYRAHMQAFSIVLPYGYHVTYLHEAQSEGVFRHISISVDRAGKAPSPEAVRMILRSFGMNPEFDQAADIWVETVDSETKAINVLQKDESR